MRLTILSLFMLVSAQLSAQNFWSEKQVYAEKTFSADEVRKLVVETSGGNIKVEGGAREARVLMYVQKRGSYLESGDDLEGWEYSINMNGSTLVARAKNENKGSWGRNNKISISFVVEVPTDISSDLKTSGGNIELRDLIGDQLFSTSGGNLVVQAVSGRIDGRTSGGNITATDSKGDLVLETSGGNINLNGVSGLIEIGTSGGNLNLNEVSGTIDGRTSGGGIDAKVVSVDKSLELHTSGGSVRIALPADDGYDLNLSGSFVKTDLNNFSGTSKKNYIRGTMNGGGKKVSASTSGGGVRLEYY